MASVFITGGTGFAGRELVRRLMERGHGVRALARAGSESKLPAGCRAVIGDPLEAASYRDAMGDADTLVHLVGARKPAPWKGKQFRTIDLGSLAQSLEAARGRAIRHFVYVSVAQPAPVMKSYIAVRQECERRIQAAAIPATILRPWYVLGPGRSWPLLLLPVYKALEAMGNGSARRLGLVTLDEMAAAMVWAIEQPGNRVLEVADIRRLARGTP